MKKRLVIPEMINKKHSYMAIKMNELNIEGQILPVKEDEYDNGEEFIVVHGQGFTVGYVPKEWLVDI